MELNLCVRCASDCRYERTPYEIVVECGMYKPPMTNADCIRAMSDKELATMLNRFVEGEDAPRYCRNLSECDADMEADRLIPLERCRKCLLHWLRCPPEGDVSDAR